VAKVVLLILLSIILGGCASPTVLIHPISPAEIFRMEAGKPYTSEKSGWFLSDFYVKEIIGASVVE